MLNTTPFKGTSLLLSNVTLTLTFFELEKLNPSGAALIALSGGFSGPALFFRQEIKPMQSPTAKKIGKNFFIIFLIIKKTFIPIGKKISFNPFCSVFIKHLFLSHIQLI